MYTYKMIQVPPNISVKAKDNKAGWLLHIFRMLLMNRRRMAGNFNGLIQLV